MTDEKKDCKKEVVTKCKNGHLYIITGWATKSGHQQATQMRCSQCLIPVCLEELEQKEWRESEGI